LNLGSCDIAEHQASLCVDISQHGSVVEYLASSQDADEVAIGFCLAHKMMKLVVAQRQQLRKGSSASPTQV
jgi:hypothetical protein